MPIFEMKETTKENIRQKKFEIFKEQHRVSEPLDCEADL
jgi:hypothetical protein